MAADSWLKRAGGLLIPKKELAVNRPCCCGGNVLIWLLNVVGNPHGTFSFEKINSIYINMGLRVHFSGSWTGRLNDYRLIIWPTAFEDPIWWENITDGSWPGRLHMTSENGTQPAFVPSTAYVDGKSGLTGIGNVGGVSYDAGYSEGTIEADDLTDGIADFFGYGFASEVTGGTVLSRTFTGNHPWIAHNRSGNIDWVIAGDMNHMEDTADWEGNNTAFFQNLWTVPV